jgi:hypothetical protein
MAKTTIEKTGDLEKFSFLSFNRGICKHHLTRVIDSISKNNQLHLHPIIVDEEFNVMESEKNITKGERDGVGFVGFVGLVLIPKVLPALFPWKERRFLFRSKKKPTKPTENCKLLKQERL